LLKKTLGMRPISAACSYSAALKAVTDVVGKLENYETWQAHHVREYEFN
jgi:hypothetical protein